MIHFIRPQPTRELGADGAIILIIEVLHDEMAPGMSPVLALTCDSADNYFLASPTMYVPNAVDSTSLLSYFGMSYLFVPRGFRQCELRVASSPVGPYLAPVSEGMLIKLVVGARLRIFGQASAWFPDLERFASFVREAVRAGRRSVDYWSLGLAALRILYVQQYSTSHAIGIQFADACLLWLKAITFTSNQCGCRIIHSKNHEWYTDHIIFAMQYA